uniref:50S ribosomal protein L19-2, chloroplastic-like n=1 Tax=Erigeron canadensis TaxID=72917 RepID=UPI001CB99881|nr:50S ribosomal protein L19-2, chloroplastic-like [Erigeron canadensis]
MASIVLPQGLYMINTTTNVAKLQSQKLRASCSSAFVSSFNSNRSPLVSRRCRFDSSGFRNRECFVVRAEADDDTAAEGEAAAADNVEAVSEEAEQTVVAVVEDKPPKKPIVKLGDIMGILNKQAIEASDTSRPIPDLRTGDIVEIKLEVPENRRRLSIYKGIVISKQNAGIHTTIRIRRIIAGVGVEIVFPIYSPNIKEIKVVKHRKVRRARLYYLRDKLPRLSTFK